ncbi:6-phosphogluconolactonase [Afifella sp. IM 167]|uniref:6-phosphogluconolactonase n=1 Tax=Afifella sp. IM 167 TaxID=2033586 RepID=UPI001CCF1524|nr:6-phosphogluconolactonase [Afifella sp. IM 167]MBZ8134984.1 6-phosphogluconolactonase [Afifella sp. IM 167]
MTIHRHDHSGREAVAEALADRVAEELSGAIDDDGQASLAVSGGSTPKLFFEKLALRDLDWEHVTITLVDERWVPADHERSNARLAREHLLRAKAAAARFVPLYTGAPTPEDGVGAAILHVETVLLPFASVVLGMGGDGHTASWFPGGDNLSAAIDPVTDMPLLPMRAEAAGEPRITFTLTPLLKTRSLILHVEGEDKLTVLEAALGEGPVEEMPIRAILRQSEVPLDIYTAP